MKWILVKDTAELLTVTPKAVKKKLSDKFGTVQTRNYSFEYKFVKGVKGTSNRALRKDHYEILLESLPEEIQIKYAHKISEKIKNNATVKESLTVASRLAKVIERDNGIDVYNDAPEWQRDIADGRYRCITDSSAYKGKKLEQWVKKIWNIQNPKFETSVKTLYRWRKAYKECGLGGLLTGYGKANNTKTITDNKFETFDGYFSKITPESYKIFKQLWLKDGAPSLQSSWRAVVGYASKNEKNYNFETFPSMASFKRAVYSELGESSIYRVRAGAWKWNKKYGYYISRDSSDVKPGDVWVSDHAQLDVGVIGPDGKIAFPWITVWQDFKTGKWLGWTLFVGNPNSDRIFEVFYKTAVKYGLPKEILIDNGKDYRSKDFAGGRPKAHTHLIVSEEDAKVSMVHRMGIKVHFSLPYNAQAKPIERGFNTLKEGFSKHQTGYRGGNVVERPEILQEEINKGLIHSISELEPRFNNFIENVINNNPNSGKYHKGRSRNKMWEDEVEGLRMVDREELKLFCMRTTKPIRIGRNGIVDRIDRITYYAAWMIKLQGEYVYMRRDPLRYEEAWIYDLNDKFIDKAFMVTDTKAFADEDVTRDQVKEANRIKRHTEKIVKEAVQIKSFTPEEQDEMFELGALELARASGMLPTGKLDPVSEMVSTDFGDAIKISEQKEHEGEYDEAIFTPVMVKEGVDVDIWKSEFEI